MNRTRQPNRLSTLLKKSGFDHDMALNSKLDSLLQSHLKQYNIDGCRIGNFQNGSLLIEIPNATWMMRLQFMRTELISLLRQQAPSLARINIKVNPKLAKKAVSQQKKSLKNIKRASKIPADVADSLLALADDSDPELKAALRSLASYTKK
ncbi:MAG: DciA family protein [Psychromonas sp.]